ncbi:vascular endothelial growth factor receptor 1-like [Neodiprion virginianus]|uniref:vascular endothelial growth factor receptor 1-like n=1 Tax=Neodiprion virginianus TaxID=2961670 RepID=UPI001EE6E314|nr:vascular endothelial growth factor receptor 1-like [Neodiprion virginianus]
MRCITATWIFILLVALLRDTESRKPTMIPEKEQLVIKEGDELRLSCRGDGPIQFSTMKLSGDNRQSNYTIVSGNNKGEYTFVVPHAAAVDTGWYGCAEDGITIINDEQTIERPGEDISWIYVFVNSANRSFANKVNLAGSEIIRLPGSSFVIPCRTTAEDLKPKFLYFYTEANPAAHGFRFDPKIGFIKDEVGVEDYGDYTCAYPFPNNVEKDEEQTYHLELDLDNLKPPFVDENEFHHLVWGRNQTITCNISSETHNWDEDTYYLKWTAPSSVPETRLVHKNPTAESTQLTIINVEESDSGVYICTVMGQFRSKSTPIKVQFHDPNRPHLKVIESSENATFVNVTEKSTAVWAIDIDTYPKATVTWLSKDKTVITDTSKYSHTVDGLRHTFQISDVRITDVGVYTVHIDTSNQTRDCELVLMVQAAPVAHIGESSSYYALGETARFSCYTSGSPLPNITWSYLEYPAFPSKTIVNRANFSKISNELSEFSTVDLVSHANITINMAGDLICKSCNNIDCVEVIQSIFVSDGNGSFGIIDPGYVVEGDNIDVTCGASVHNYTDDITWDVKNASRNGSVIINKRTTNFTFQSILVLKNVQKSDSGDYFCKAVNKNNHDETVVYHLSVLDAHAPSIIESNMNNSEISIDLGKDEKATRRLTCIVEGMPFPEITWLKDGERLENNEQYVISPNKSELHIRYFFGTDSGNYSCRAKSRLGVSEKSLRLLIKEAPRNNAVWIGLICVLIAVIVGVVIYMRFKVKREERLKQEYRNMALSQLQQRSPDFNLNDEDELLPIDQVATARPQL